MTNYLESALLHYNRKYNSGPIPLFRTRSIGVGYELPFDVGGVVGMNLKEVRDKDFTIIGIKLVIDYTDKHGDEWELDSYTLNDLPENLRVPESLESPKYKVKPGDVILDEVVQMLDNHWEWVRYAISHWLTTEGCHMAPGQTQNF